LKEIRWQAEIDCAYDKRHAQACDRDRYEQKKNAGVAFMNLHFNQISLSLASMSRALVCTENSYKYTLNQISRLAEQSDLSVRVIFTDKRKWFALALLGHIQQTSQL
jgi:uncharacterized SAM-dependent methyltransferase